MITTLGEYVDNVQNVKYSLLMISDNTNVSVYLALGGRVVSAFKHEGEDDFCLSNKLAKIAYDKVATGLKKCSSSNCNPIPFELGVASRYMAEAKGTSYTIEKFGKDISGLEIADEKFYMFAEYTNQNIQIPSELNWVKIGRPKKKEADEFGDINNNDIPVRSLSEIALEKDLTWLDKKRYYIVNEDESVEYVISAIEDYVRKYNGIVVYDVETSGLFINMFGKIGSSKQKDMEAINAERAKRDLNPYRVDTLTGLILTITPDEGFYFPVRNRKFKNAYDDVDSEVRKKTTSKIKADYTIGEFRTRDDDMAKWIRSHKEEGFTSDIILMERLRWLLTHANICAHNGVMEWKTTWLYNIDLNLRDDTMIMHKLMYKFNDMSRGNAGERSDLKYLTKTRLGIDQLELTDFFVDYKEDDSGLVNASGKRKGKKKSGVRIDFSYMDYDGAKAYAPADGDFTLQLCHMFKKDLLENHRNMEYLYQVEIIVSCAIAYMEFYGHRIDENKIDEIRHDQLIEQLMLEGKFRKQIEYANAKENEALANLEWAYKRVKELRKSKADKEEITKALNNRTELANVYREILNESDKPMNMASPQQISNLFYNELHYMEAKPGEKESIGKEVLKQYTKMKNEDGSPKYPAIVTYTEWKSVDTLLTKFFDNLPDFMYPGGYIFSSFGQISTATGRMSCAKPNVQQYPKSVSAIVIPRDGCVMIDADFSQIEYRTLVAMAHEDALLERFKDPDMDYHTTMASLMYGVPYASVTPKMRGDAKSFNFGIPYGMGFGSLAILLNGNKSKQSVEEAKEKYELYFKEQPNVRKFFGDVKAKAKFNGQTETLWHRVRKYNFLDKNGNYSQKLEAQGLRRAGNAIIQGCERGDTLIQTKEYGIVQVRDVVNKHLKIWNGTQWTNGDIVYAGKKRKCIVTFSTGQQFVCSPIHKFLVKSHRGNERFVECQNLHSRETHKSNPYRVVINREYEPSDWKYTSDEARSMYASTSSNAKNVFLDDISDSFKIGVVLGRLASDGNIVNSGNNHVIRQIIAEHEHDVYDTLREYMEPLGLTEYNTGIREGRTQNITQLKVNSKSLASEVCDLDIKHTINPGLFRDTELLRGFLRGVFDGDGGISGSVIALTFGVQDDFEEICRAIQKALLFFGIRARYYKYEDRHKITISTYDNQRFLDLIGFINCEKQAKGRALGTTKNDEHIFGRVLTVESVEITDEYIDMYDVCNTDGGYYVADGVITHNTAADIFKIAVARTFLYIRNNNLFEKFYITNMVHDEQLTEIDVRKLNPKVALKGLVEAMELKLDGFPPLFVGAGVGDAWAHAKGKMAEIHPDLVDEFVKEASNEKLYLDKPMTPEEVIKYFDNRVYEYRKNRVIDYITDPKNFGEPIYPVIGNLLSLQFDFGVTSEFNAEYTEENGYTKEQIDAAMKGIVTEQIKRFIEEFNVDADYRNFTVETDLAAEEEEEDGYDDDEVDEDGIPLDIIDSSSFELIDEDDKVYGIKYEDIIKTYGVLVSPKHKICGISTANLSERVKCDFSSYLAKHACDSDEDGAMQVVYLKENDFVLKTEVYVKDVTSAELSKILSIHRNKVGA